MPIDISLNVQTAGAEEQLQRFLGGVAQGARNAGDSQVAAIEKAKAAYQRLLDAERRASQEAEAAGRKMAEGMGKAGAFAKGAFDAVGTSVLGVSEKMKGAVDEGLQLAQAGAQMGGSFGAWGAAIGAAAGILIEVGKQAVLYFRETEEGAHKVTPLLSEVAERYKRIAEFQERAGRSNIDTLISGLQQLTEPLPAGSSLEALTKWYAGLGAAPDLAAKATEQLDKLADSIVSFRGAASKDEFASQIEEFQKMPKTAKEAGDQVDGLILLMRHISEAAHDAAFEVHGVTDPAKLTLAHDKLEVLKSDYEEVTDLLKRAREQAIELGPDNEKAQKEEQKSAKDTAKAIDESTQDHRRDMEDIVAFAEQFKDLDFLAAPANQLSEAAKLSAQKRLEEAQAWQDINTSMALSVEAAFRFGQGLSEVHAPLNAIRAQVKELGDTLAGGFGGAVGDAFSVLFDNISQGKKAFDGFGAAFQKATAAFLKHTGTQLIADGTKHVLMGGAEAIATLGVKGLDELAAGGIEIAEGLAMGGIGGVLGKRDARASAAGRGGGAVDGGARLGSSVDGGGPTTLNPVVVYLGPQQGTTIISGSGEEHDARLGAHVQRALAAASRGGPGLQR